MVFAVPRDGKTYLGTTDTDYKGDIAHPAMTEEDRTYLLQAANFIFPSLKLKAGDMESSWAGLRPLIQQEGKDPSEVSRRDEIFISPSGLLSIAGGKLTGYRKMAETVVNRVGELMAEDGKKIKLPSSTKHLPISGGDVGGSQRFERYVLERIAEGCSSGLDEAEANRLARRYGSNVPKLFQLASEFKSFAEAHGLSLALTAELRYAIEEEGAIKPEDFWVRRTGRLYFDISSVQLWGNAVLLAMTEWLGWSESQQLLYQEEMERLTQMAVSPAN
jgi:glycerol-3-phosphate dehydrogenase